MRLPQNISEIPPLPTWNHPQTLREWGFLDQKNIQIWIDYLQGKVFAVIYSPAHVAESKILMAEFDKGMLQKWMNEKN